MRAAWENFAVVDRLDLLEERYGYRATWTETVQFEIRRGLRAEPRLQRVLDCRWLGEPIAVETSAQALRDIDLIRRALGGSPARPTEHLGEAEIIYLLEATSTGAVFISDDRPAASLAKRRGLQVLDSSAVPAECFSFGEVGCPEAYELLMAMVDNNRGVHIPPDHSYVC